MQKLFVDTNVFLDVIFARHRASEIFFDAAREQSYTLCVSLKTVMDIHYFSKAAFSKEEVKAMLADLVEMHLLLQTSQQNVLDALQSKFSDFEDAVQNFTAASEEGMKAIITRNKKDFRHSGLQVHTPEEFVKKNSPD